MLMGVKPLKIPRQLECGVYLAIQLCSLSLCNILIFIRSSGFISEKFSIIIDLKVSLNLTHFPLSSSLTSD